MYAKTKYFVASQVLNPPIDSSQDLYLLVYLEVCRQRVKIPMEAFRKMKRPPPGFGIP
jgi:hypothetical protein